MIRISPVAKVEPAPHAVLRWDVTGLPAMTAALTEQGVVFERYPGLIQNALGVWLAPSKTMVAWFKDPDGNLLSISEHP